MLRLSLLSMMGEKISLAPYGKMEYIWVRNNVLEINEM
jgi:hypothetical protein